MCPSCRAVNAQAFNRTCRARSSAFAKAPTFAEAPVGRRSLGGGWPADRRSFSGGWLDRATVRPDPVDFLLPFARESIQIATEFALALFEFRGIEDAGDG